MTKTLCTFIISVFFYTSLLAQADKIDSSQMRTLRIDPESARGAAVSQVFDEVQFVPLETTKESLFGSISQLEVTDKYYIIYDYDTKSILIFSKDGKYKNKISASKIEKDPSDKNAQNFYGFALIKENDEPVIQVYLGRSYLYFNLEGTMLRKVPSKDVPYGNARKFTDGTKVERGYTDKKDKDSTNYEVALLKADQEVAKYFPYNKDRNKMDQFYGSGENLTDSGVPNEFFYITFYEYNIYKLSQKNLALNYRIIFPAANSLPADFKTNPLYVNKRQEFFSKNTAVIFSISNAYEIGDNLYFKTGSWSWSKDKKNALIYNLKSGALTSITNVEPDSLSSFLPVTDAGHFYDFQNRGFHKFVGGYFYTSYSSLAMFAFKEQNESKNRTYNDVLTNYFKTSDKKSNPIIIQLKPKKD
jgi:hypothetical protein